MWLRNTYRKWRRSGREHGDPRKSTSATAPLSLTKPLSPVLRPEPRSLFGDRSFKNQTHTHTPLTTFPSFPSTLCSSRPATQTPEVFFGRQTPNIYFPSLIENRQETLFSFAFSASLGLFFLFPLVTGAELDPCSVPGSGPGFQLMSHTGLASVPCLWAVNMVVCRR